MTSFYLLMLLNEANRSKGQNYLKGGNNVVMCHRKGKKPKTLKMIGKTQKGECNRRDSHKSNAFTPPQIKLLHQENRILNQDRMGGMEKEKQKKQN